MEQRPGAGEHVGTLPRLPFLSGSLSCFSALAALSSVDTRGQYMLILEGRVWRFCFFFSLCASVGDRNDLETRESVSQR